MILKYDIIMAYSIIMMDFVALIVFRKSAKFKLFCPFTLIFQI